jgi:outer membrane protein
LAESHNPETRVAWERARSLADAFGVARSELYPTISGDAQAASIRPKRGYLHLILASTTRIGQ